MRFFPDEDTQRQIESALRDTYEEHEQIACPHCGGSRRSWYEGGDGDGWLCSDCGEPLYGR